MKSSDELKLKKGIPSVLTCENLAKSYGDFSVLSNISFSLKKGEKVGLVGSNGSGKSTLLKILAEIETPDKGSVITKSTIGYIPQEASNPNQKAEDFLLEYDIQHSTSPQTLLGKLKFGISKNILQRPVGTLSGGEQQKLGVARIMLAPFDVLLLDEPTNNLDLPALKLLEDFIASSNKTFLIVSHDRAFLDRLAVKIIEIDKDTHGIHIYDGNYSEYEKERTLRIKREWQAYSNATKRKKQLQNAAEQKMQSASNLEQTIKDKRKQSSKITEKFHNTWLRTKAGKSTKRARILRDRIDRQGLEEVEKPKTRLPLKMSFDVGNRSGDKVFEMENIIVKKDSFKIGPINLAVQYGDRILILGSNGAGKTTLLNALLNTEEKTEGCVKKGSNVNTGYLPQKNTLNKDEKLIDVFREHVGLKESVGRKLLNRFSITGENIEKKIKDISPGMLSRFILAILMAQKPNCLILDEPSNHLDLEAIEELERALQRFAGTIIAVSHDRRFIENLNVTKTYLLQNGELKQVSDYHKYENGQG